PVLWRLFPSARVLVAVRDPRDVIVSCFLRYLPVTPVSVHFLDMTWLADKYVHDLRCWLKLREISPATLWDEVRYEELVADFPAVTRRAIERLGLAWDPSILDYRQQLSSRRPVHSPTYDAVAKPVHRGAIGRWRNYSQQIGPVLEKLMPLVESFGYSC
ncbi:MAG: sulfotransferase, partial [Planctomycetales bacterium]|nr:sulfotransferase [Planctomycetales bacterium]